MVGGRHIGQQTKIMFCIVWFVIILLPIINRGEEGKSSYIAKEEVSSIGVVNYIEVYG